MSHRSLIRLAALSLALAAVVPAESATLKGKAAFGDGAALPAGSVLRLTLQDMTSNGAIVVTGTVAARGKKAIGFRLKYDEDALEERHLYGLDAAITDSEGRALWSTLAPVRVLTMGNPDSVRLELKRAGMPREAAAGPTSFRVQCAEFAFDVRANGKTATVVLPDRTVVLEREDSPSGERYSGNGTTLSISGKAVYFQQGGKVDRTCQIAGS